MFAFVSISPLVSEAGSVSLLVFEQGSASLSPNIEISAPGVPGPRQGNTGHCMVFTLKPVYRFYVNDY